MIKALAVLDKNRAIGNKGKLLFHLPSDLKHFKKHSIGQTVIIGRNTLESFPGGKPLKGRNTIVVSRTIPQGIFYQENGFFAASFNSPERAICFAKALRPDCNIIISGGEQIYRAMIPWTDELVLTQVDANAPEADAFFPEYSSSFELYEKGENVDENGLTYSIEKYRRKNV